MRDGRLVRASGSVDQPGVLAKLDPTDRRDRRQYHRGGTTSACSTDVPAKQADLDVMVETRNPAHVDQIVGLLKAQGFPTRIVSSRSIDPGS